MKFDEAYEQIPGNGWLTKDEAELLWYYAAHRTDVRTALEVGCFQGRSTVLLALSGLHSVYCVDPFDNFHTDLTGDEVCRLFTANVLGRGIGLTAVCSDGTVTVLTNAQLLSSQGTGGPARGNVTLFRQRVEDWVPRFVDLAYLDGDHTYEGTLAQVRKALACHARYVLIHDVNDAGGGADVKRAALELLGPWKTRVGRLAAWELNA